jgi:hypothetical protein
MNRLFYKSGKSRRLLPVGHSSNIIRDLRNWQESLLVYPDVGFHAVPAIILVFDLLYLSPPWTITFLPSMALATAITFGYWFWVELCYTYNGW